ncbi:hypothetical protein ACA30_10505 [Virgibacillus soli]|nr:hypothetical protein ACA30_10505 [Virgibacillus soli]
MLIQCTKTLLEKLGIQGTELASPEDNEDFPKIFLAWHANFVSINRRKAIVLMNNETRYPVVIYRPSSKDFSKIKDLIYEAISEAFRMEGVRKEVIEAYMAEAGEISFSKTANRSMVAKMNNAVRDIEFMNEYLDEKSRIQRYISIVAGRFIQMSGASDSFYPIEKTLEYLGAIFGIDEHVGDDEVLDIDLYQLKIQINLEGHDIWRRVLVPSTYSFRHLHHIIQTVFDWQNYHLHEFTVKGSKNKSLKIVMDDDLETMEYFDFDDFEMLRERFVALEEVLPEFGEVTYEYDFGDSWEHTVKLEKIVNSKTFQATFLEGNGERPPEDVGGAGGFEEYIRIMENEKHPSYHEMKVWAENQKERNLNLEKINQRLKQVISGYKYSTFVF